MGKDIIIGALLGVAVVAVSHFLLRLPVVWPGAMIAPLLWIWLTHG